jgi:hypothetical protein
MASYVSFSLPDGGTIQAELAEPSGQATRGGTRGDIPDPTMAFEAAMAKLKPICSAIVKQAKEMVEQPEEFSVEFGIKLNAEAGVVIAKTSAEANLKISVKWKKAEK